MDGWVKQAQDFYPRGRGSCSELKGISAVTYVTSVVNICDFS